MASTKNHECSTVVLGIDESDYSVKAMDFYLDFFHTDDRKVVLAHSIEVPHQPLQPLRMDVVKKIMDSTKAEAKDVQNKFAAILSSKGVKYEIKSEFGQPGQYICKVAEEVGAQLVVIGTRGVGKVRRTILGSVSDYVMTNAQCPVFICRG